MQLVWVGFAAFFCVSLSVGARLLWLGIRRSEMPALLIGVGVLGIGPVGFGLQACALALSKSAAAEGLASAGAAALALGVWAKLLFNWTVYRPGSRIALAFTSLLAAAVAAQLLAQPLGGSFLEAAQNITMAAARGALQVAALGWGAAEALLYWGRMRRRERLGLADPVLTNRFLLWGVSAGSAALGTAIGVVHSLVTGVASLESPPILASASAHGLVAAVGMWLAFIPPRAYLRWVAGSRAAA